MFIRSDKAVEAGPTPSVPLRLHSSCSSRQRTPSILDCVDERSSTAATPGTPFRARARVRIPYYFRWPFLVAAALFVLLAATVLVVLEAAIPALVAAIVMLLSARDRVSAFEDVTVDGDTLLIGARAIAVSSIGQALLVPTKALDFVRLARRGRLDVDLAFEVVWQSDAFLRAMGLDPTRRAADFYLRSPARHTWGGFLAFAALLVTSFSVIALAQSPWALASLLPVAAIFAPCRVRVGADGVERRWLFFRHMVRVASIHDVTVHAQPTGPTSRNLVHRVDLHLADASTFSLCSGSAQTAAIVAERVRGVHRAHRRAPRRGIDLVNALSRGPRTAGEWLAHLRALTRDGADAGAGYRSAAIERTDLLRVAEDAALAAPVRLAAAVALGVDVDETERKRIAELAVASADAQVRDGMTRIAEAADDAAIEEALFAAEEASAKSSRFS